MDDSALKRVSFQIQEADLLYDAGRYEDAQHQYAAIADRLAIERNPHSEELRANALRDCASCRFHMRDWSDSLAWYHKARDVSCSNRDEAGNPRDERGIADAEAGLAGAYIAVRSYNQALHFARSARMRFEEDLNDPPGRLLCLSLMGEALLKLGQIDVVIKELREVTESPGLVEQSDLAKLAARTAWLLGQAYLCARDHKGARKAFDYGRGVADGESDAEARYRNWEGLGQCYELEQQLDQAHDKFMGSLSIAKHARLPELVSAARKNLIRVLRNMGYPEDVSRVSLDALPEGDARTRRKWIEEMLDPDRAEIPWWRRWWRFRRGR
ncbi:MAG TPA: hypothetical protein PKE40_03680 [Arachnia sp.]|nr:hypothetical protein [Arachnia sp.]HMT85431.1 hypothetical protein [Arachnia sp.]